MKSLHRRAARLRFAAWQPRSSQLGILYLLAALTTIGVIFRLIFIFFSMTQKCYPAWDFWLAGFHHHTSLFEIIVVCLIGLSIIVVIDLVAYVRSSTRIKASSVAIYLTLLSLPLWTLCMFYLLWGAMIPTSDAREVYERVDELTALWVDFYSESDPPDGPFGTCPPNPFRQVYGSPPPETIGAL